MTAEQLAAAEKVAFQIIGAAVEAAPIIAQDINNSLPYVQAIVELIKSGGAPTEEAFAAVRQRLDEGSAFLQRKAAEAQAMLDAEGGA